MICLESDNESESDSQKRKCEQSEWIGSDCYEMKNIGASLPFDSAGSGSSHGRLMLSLVSFPFLFIFFMSIPAILTDWSQ